MNNIEAEQLTRLCDDIHRIANHLTKDDELENNGAYAMLSGSVIGAANSLEYILDTSSNEYDKAQKLRSLIDRWKELSNEYSKRQAQIDQQRAELKETKEN